MFGEILLHIGKKTGKARNQGTSVFFPNIFGSYGLIQVKLGGMRDS